MKTRLRDPLWNKTPVQSSLDFSSPGKRCGDLRLRYSNNQYALGYIPIPTGVVVNGNGPTVLLTGGVHGDEFEGPIALIKFLNDVDVDAVRGRIIVIPTLNAPALHVAARVSPLDDVNLNRAFPGDPKGTPTQIIAHFIEKALMPVCDVAIDLHSGGKAFWFSPCAMATYDNDPERQTKTVELAEVFGCPYVWLMGMFNDDRTVNGAALRNNIPSIAAELGGGGQATPETVKLGEQGIHNCLRHLNVLTGDQPLQLQKAKFFKIIDANQHIYSTHRGLFEPAFSPGDSVVAGDPVGYIHNISQLDTPAVRVEFTVDGVAFVRCHRGLVEHGELLALVGVESSKPDGTFELNAYD